MQQYSIIVAPRQLRKSLAAGNTHYSIYDRLYSNMIHLKSFAHGLNLIAEKVPTSFSEANASFSIKNNVSDDFGIELKQNDGVLKRNSHFKILPKINGILSFKSDFSE